MLITKSAKRVKRRPHYLYRAFSYFGREGCNGHLWLDVDTESFSYTVQDKELAIVIEYAQAADGLCGEFQQASQEAWAFVSKPI